jgi:hypothetical protein
MAAERRRMTRVIGSFCPDPSDQTVCPEFDLARSLAVSDLGDRLIQQCRRLKHRLRPMRGLRTEHTATETPRPLRVAAAFTELAQAI